MAQSGICDAICNVQEDELQEIEDLVTDLTRQLRVAVGVRDALKVDWVAPATADDRSAPARIAAAVQKLKKPGRKPRKTAEFAREPRKPRRPIEATVKTLEIGKMLQRRGPMTKEALADALGWKFHQVAMVIGRSAKFFNHTDDGKFDVTPTLAKLL